MRELITCALNNAGLFELDDRIYVENITEEINVDHEAANRADYGMIPLNVARHKSIVLTVKLMIKERIRHERDSVIRKIQGWAKQGWLTTNMRPGKRLYVFCTKYPKVEAFKTTERLEVQFTAYGEAYWQDTVPLSFQSESASSSATVEVNPECTHECFFEAIITNKDSTDLTSVTIAIGSKSLQLTGLTIGADETVSIYYDDLHLLHIESDGTSLLSKRTASSADDLILEPDSTNTITLTFDVSCDYTVNIRRLWE